MKCVLYFHSQESLAQRSSPLVYCLPFVRKFILIGMSMFGRSTTLKTCFPVHSFTGYNKMKQFKTTWCIMFCLVCKLPDGRTVGLTDRQTDTDTWTDSHTDKHADRHADRQTNRQMEGGPDGDKWRKMGR